MLMFWMILLISILDNPQMGYPIQGMIISFVLVLYFLCWLNFFFCSSLSAVLTNAHYLKVYSIQVMIFFSFFSPAILKSWPWCLLNSSIVECKKEVNYQKLKSSMPQPELLQGSSSFCTISVIEFLDYAIQQLKCQSTLYNNLSFRRYIIRDTSF